MEYSTGVYTFQLLSDGVDLADWITMSAANG